MYANKTKHLFSPSFFFPALLSEPVLEPELSYILLSSEGRAPMEVLIMSLPNLKISMSVSQC